MQFTTNFDDEFLGFWIYIALSNAFGHPVDILREINNLDLVKDGIPLIKLFRDVFHASDDALRLLFVFHEL